MKRRWRKTIHFLEKIIIRNLHRRFEISTFVFRQPRRRGREEADRGWDAQDELEKRHADSGSGRVRMICLGYKNKSYSYFYAPMRTTRFAPLQSEGPSGYAYFSSHKCEGLVGVCNFLHRRLYFLWHQQAPPPPLRPRNLRTPGGNTIVFYGFSVPAHPGRAVAMWQKGESTVKSNGEYAT